MATAIEASRALVYETARHMDAGLPDQQTVGNCQVQRFNNTAKFCADKTQQIFGGYGLRHGIPHFAL